MSFTKQDAKSNIRLLYIFQGLIWFILLVPVIIPFFKSKGLDMHQIYQLQALFAATIVIFEVPSGYLSDMWGRKNTLIVSCLVDVLAAAFLVMANDFWTLALFEFTLGIGMALRSGTDLSLMYDSAYAAGEIGGQKSTLSRLLMISTFSESAASILAGVLAMKSMDWVVWGFAIILAAPLLIVFFLKEPPRQRLESGVHWDNLKMILKYLFKTEKKTQLVLLNGMLWSASTLLIVWTYQDVWENIGISLVWFGILWAIQNFAVGLFAKYVPRAERRWGQLWVLYVMPVSILTGYLGYAMVGHWSVFLFSILLSLGRAINSVIFKDELNQQVPSEFRATANSMWGLGVRMIFVILGPLLGFLLREEGVMTALLTMFLMFFLGFIIVLRPYLRLQDNSL